MPYKCIWIVWGQDILLIAEKYSLFKNSGKIGIEFFRFLQFLIHRLCGRIMLVDTLAVV